MLIVEGQQKCKFMVNNILNIVKNLLLPAKTIFASLVFTMEKNVFFHWLAKTCQP